jgi:hypothetical protein
MRFRENEGWEEAKMRRIVLAVLSVWVLVVGFGLSKARAADPITGKWAFVFDTEGGAREFAADFKLDGEQVSGKFAGADVKGTFKEQKLELAFPFSSEEANMTDTLKITGKLEKEALTGEWSFSSYSGTYTAKKN